MTLGVGRAVAGTVADLAGGKGVVSRWPMPTGTSSLRRPNLRRGTGISGRSPPPPTLGLVLPAPDVARRTSASACSRHRWPSSRERDVADGLADGRLADGVEVNGGDGGRQGGRHGRHRAHLIVAAQAELCLATVDPSSRGEEVPPWMAS
jgi:hypothetical protein